MTQYTSESRVFVQPFSRQPDGDEVVIGAGGIFIALPRSAVDILDWLAAGKTVGETRALYFEKHQEQADIDDFLSSLEEMSLVVPLASDGSGATGTGTGTAVHAPQTRQPALRYHFEGFPLPLARVLTSWVAIAMYGTIVIAGLAALVAEPSLWPTRNAFLFRQDMTLMVLGLMFYSFFMLFLHEMAHLVAARASCVPTRLGWGRRLWILVAETDVSQLWTIPRSKRYMTLLAGPLYDAVSASLCICLGLLDAKGWISLPPLVTQVCRALVLMHLLNLLWQCNFFLRTDFYYVLANFFGCKSLMKDTEDFLRTLAARWLRWVKSPDISHIPARELRVVRGYALIWLLGRVNMLRILIAITLPLMWDYLMHISTTIISGFSHDPVAFIDALVLGTITVIFLLVGLSLWIRSLLQQKPRSPRHEMAVRAVL